MVHEKAEKLEVSCRQEMQIEGNSQETCLRLELPVYEVVMNRSWWVRKKEFRRMIPNYGQWNQEDDGVLYRQGIDLVRTRIGVLVVV